MGKANTKRLDILRTVEAALEDPVRQEEAHGILMAFHREGLVGGTLRRAERLQAQLRLATIGAS